MEEGVMPKKKNTKYKKTRHEGVRRYLGAANTYDVYFRPHKGAKTVHKTVCADSDKAAQLKKIEYELEYSKRIGIDKKGRANGLEALKAVLKNKCLADGNKEKTIKNYLKIFERFCGFISADPYCVTELDKISISLMEEYKEYIVLDQGLDLRNELTKLRSIINKFIAKGLCDRRIYYDVICKIAKPKQRKKIYKDVSKEDRTAFLKYVQEVRPDYYGILYLNMRFGWRRSQVIRIEKVHIKTDKGKPTEVVFPPDNTKNGEPFIFQGIDKELEKTLNEYRMKNLKSKYLFPNRDGGLHHANHYTEWIRKHTTKVLGKTLSPHDFRHCFCTEMLGKGHSKRDIMAVSGHKDEKCFDIYTHPTSVGTKKVIDQSRLFD